MTATPSDDPGAGAAASVWRGLVDATTRRTGWTLATLATAGTDGAPHARSVILRACDPATGTVGFATDARSAKVRDLAADPRVELVVWDEGTGVQARLGGRAAVVTDPAERRRRWDALGPHSRRGYASAQPPGEPLGAGEAAEDGGGDDEAAWFERFAWVEVRVERIDRLDLSDTPHERVLVERTADGWREHRVAP